MEKERHVRNPFLMRAFGHHGIIFRESRDYVLVYQDDGVGMNVAGVRRSFGTMGLPGLIGRVEGMGGRMQLRSGKGGGLYVAIHWPKRT